MIITNEEEYEAALARLDEILHSGTDTPEYEEMLRLSADIEAYEDKHYPMEADVED